MPLQHLLSAQTSPPIPAFVRPQAHANAHAQAAPPVPSAAEPRPQAAAAPTSQKSVDVFAGDLAQARASLKASCPDEKQAASAMHEMATELKHALSQGRTSDLEAFQAKHQDKLDLPEDFATNTAARLRLAKVLNESMKTPQ